MIYHNKRYRILEEAIYASAALKAVLYISDFTLIPALEDLIFTVGAVAVLFIELPAHIVFFQHPDNKF